MANGHEPSTADMPTFTLQVGLGNIQDERSYGRLQFLQYCIIMDSFITLFPLY